MSMQYAQPLICEARSLIRCSRFFSIALVARYCSSPTIALYKPGAAAMLKRGCMRGNSFPNVIPLHRIVGQPEDDAMIRKLKSGEYRLYSRKKNPKTGKRRNLGTFKTRDAAQAHERAVQFFKRH